MNDAALVIDTVRQFNTAILAVPGNWDGTEVSAYLSAQGLNLHRRHVIRDQIAFIGVGAALISGYLFSVQPGSAPSASGKEPGKSIRLTMDKRRRVNYIG